MSKKIALIGDLILDKFINYKSVRLSPEGPAPIVKKVGSFEALGGSANVALSLLNLGINFQFFYPYSKKLDPDIDIVLNKILKSLENYSEKIFTDIQDINPIKTRYYVDDRQYMREDKEGSNLSKISVISNDLIDIIVGKSDFIVVSDYQKGCLNTESLKYLIKCCNKLKKPIFIDTKNKNPESIRNAFCLKINKNEFNSLFPNYELRDNNSQDEIKNKVTKVKECFNIKNLIVTLGSAGSIAIANSNFIFCPSFKVDVIDITGAGDAFLSALIYSFIEKNNKKEKNYSDISLSLENIKFANYAASTVVSKKGTVAIDQECKINYESKFEKKEIIGFTNGCFDLLHDGHLFLLEQSKKYCDYLIIGLNSDDSVKRLKGKDRPINNQNFRKKLLESLRIVDKVIIFSEDTPENLIEEIKPDVLIKGNDYREEEIVGASFVKGRGGRIIRVEFEYNTSSSKIIKQIKKL